MKNGIIISAAVLAAIGCSTAGIHFLSEDKAATGYSDEAEAYEEQKATVASASDTDNKQAERQLSEPVSADTATKADVWHMMLNTIDYYNEASGTFIFSNSDMNSAYVVDFQCDLPGTSAYSRCESYSVDNLDAIDPESIRASHIISRSETFCGDGHEITIYHSDMSYKNLDHAITRLEDCVPIADTDRVKTEPDGNPGFHYRANPTNVDMSSMCLLPQELTIGFLKDTELWELNGTAEYNGRECWHITGTASPEYGSKLNVSEFEFLVDTQTGVLMKYEGYDENGALSDYMYSFNIQFGDDAKSVKRFSPNMIAGYRER